jgi:hypothetical protein
MGRKSFSGAAAQTVLTSPMGISDTLINVGATTNWPNTTIGPFVVTIDRGQPNEEKVLITSYTSTVLTVFSGGRGYDGTTAQTHTVGVTGQVACTLDAFTINEANAFVAANGTIVPTTSLVGDAAAKGTSVAPAAADHKHARELFGVGLSTSVSPGSSTSDGSSISPARADHAHANVGWGTAGNVSTITPGSPTTSQAGVTNLYARNDHIHALVLPAGRMTVTSQTVLASGVQGQIAMTQDAGCVRGSVVYASTGGGQLTVPLAGVYQVNCWVAWQAAGNPIPGGAFATQLYKNGSSVRYWASTPDATPTNFQSTGGSDLISLAANDVLTVQAAQGSGSPAGSQVGNLSYLSVFYVSA